MTEHTPPTDPANGPNRPGPPGPPPRSDEFETFLRQVYGPSAGRPPAGPRGGTSTQPPSGFPHSPLQVAALATYEMYRALVDAGFTIQEALSLVAATIAQQLNPPRG